MKRTIRAGLIVVAFVFALTGCAGVESEKAAIPTKPTVSASNLQSPVSEPKSETAEALPETADEQISAARSSGGDALPLHSETLTAPPLLTVSTPNSADSIRISCGNSQWSHTLPDGTIAALVACGAHPLDQQEHPALYTAFPAGTLPPLEENANLGAAVPVFYLDFGEISPETVSAIRWPASCIGEAQSHSTEFEEVIAELEGDMMTLVPSGDGDYVYEVSAAWGETGSASYTFRTLPAARGE